MTLESLKTPALLLDRARLERNVADMRARLDRFGALIRRGADLTVVLDSVA